MTEDQALRAKKLAEEIRRYLVDEYMKAPPGTPKPNLGDMIDVYASIRVREMDEEGDRPDGLQFGQGDAPP